MFGLSKYLVIGIAVLLAIIGVESKALFAKSKQIGTLEATAETLRQQIAVQARDSNAQAETLRVTTAAHSQCMATMRIDQENQVAAREVIAAQYHAIQTEKASVKALRAELLKAPTCAAVAALDFAVACPGLAHSLRQRAAAAALPATDYSGSPGAYPGGTGPSR